MTQGHGGQTPFTQQDSGSPTMPEAAKNEAREVATTATDRGGDVAETALNEAKHVAASVQGEARDLLREGREQLESQARDSQQMAAKSLHQLAGQLDRMVEQTDSPGVAVEVARQLSDRTTTVADWLEQRRPGDLLDEVRRFARRRPGTFLLGAAAAGVLVGRLTRGVVAQQKEPSGDANSPTGQATAPPPHPDPAVTPAVEPPVAPYSAVPQAGPGGFSAPRPPALPQPSGARLPAPGQAPS
jgi:hypothetical protein